MGVEQWAEIWRMHLVEVISIREINRRTGLHRETIRRALASERPPAYGGRKPPPNSTRSRRRSSASCAPTTRSRTPASAS